MYLLFSHTKNNSYLQTHWVFFFFTLSLSPFLLRNPQMRTPAFGYFSLVQFLSFVTFFPSFQLTLLAFGVCLVDFPFPPFFLSLREFTFFLLCKFLFLKERSLIRFHCQRPWSSMQVSGIFHCHALGRVLSNTSQKVQSTSIILFNNTAELSIFVLSFKNPNFFFLFKEITQFSFVYSFLKFFNHTKGRAWHLSLW